jgi:DNA-binding MarR family transcriptional regulator
MDERVERIQRILDCTGSLFHNLNPGRDRAWLSVDLTMPQLKALMCVAMNNGATSGQIARKLGVGLSTVTGIVDRLADQHLVTRGEDTEDRRITRVRPTPRGRVLVDDLIRYRNEMIRAVLTHLDSEQLQVVEIAFTYLIEAATAVANENNTEEAVA